MKIILLEDVRSIGKKFEVKDVSDGYARNFLFPNKLAETANPSSLAKLEARKAEHDKEDNELRKHLEGIAQKIKEVSLQFELKVGKDGSVFGSVNKESIQKALRDHSILTKERVDIDLKYPIKEIGSHTVTVDLKKGITAKLTLIVVKEEK